MSDQFATAFRSKFIDHIAETNQPGRHRRALLGTATALALVLGGTVAAAAAGLFTLPGGTEVTPVATTRSGTFTGTDTLELGPAPETATGVAMSLTCLTPGSFEFDDGASVTCTTTDDSSHPATYVLPLSAVNGGVTITTSEDAAWTLTAGYVTEETTDWAINDSGQSYGVINANGTPDLIAVIATNGQQGYVHRSDLEDADGTTASKGFTSPEDGLRWQEHNAGAVHIIPVYESDGTTRIGDFEVHGP
ncbi:hypothetical protein [Microbacterium sp. CPCC 204701]|uniref:hypothetical protein n=1 Tax=Microbacterium sp. CPCC 204701 TaxID=2493084 RepID=UPI000FD768E3|nr:hypothetical protein [Microbacterium sp. CPCC 204701]